MRVEVFNRESPWRDTGDVNPPDVVVVSHDMEMPSANTISQRLLELLPDCRIIVLIDRASDVGVIDSTKLGNVTMVSSQQGIDDLLRVISKVPTGTSSLDVDIITHALKRLQRTEGELLLDVDETDRAILRRLVLGLTDQQISDEVHIAVQSVKNRVSRMLDRFQMANRTQLAIFYERQRMWG